MFSDKFAGAGIELIDEQIITTSGNWVKPATALPMDLVVAELWGGGSAGSYAYSGGPYNVDIPGEGGWGGNYVRLMLRAFMLAPLEAAIIGSGGSPATTPYQSTHTGGTTYDFASAGPGGDTRFLGMTAKGGASPMLHNASLGIQSWGAPLHAKIEDFGRLPPSDSGNLMFVIPDAFLELGYVTGSRFCGAKGGNILRSGSGAVLPSTTAYGGAGGQAGAGVKGANGVAPGGGGGASSINLGGGFGARGEVRTRIWRGI